MKFWTNPWVVSVGGCVIFAILQNLWFRTHAYAPLILSYLVTLALSALVMWKWCRRRMVNYRAKIAGSEFSILRFAAIAKQSIFQVGTTLRFVATEPRVKTLLFKRLDEDKNFKVWLLICDGSGIPNVFEQIGLTGDCVGEWQDSLKAFRKWLEEGKPGLSIKAANGATMGLTFIDAEQDSGLLVIVPHPWKVVPDGRPCFVLTRKDHPEAFEKYYANYKNLFESVARDVREVSSVVAPTGRARTGK